MRSKSDLWSGRLLCLTHSPVDHRSLLNITVAMDVPVLYAPIAFDNASHSVPEVTCKQLQRTYGLASPQLHNRNRGDSLKRTEATSNTTCIMEMKGIFLPPWVIIRPCTVLQESQPLGFSVRFATDPLTEGLNIAQEETCKSYKLQEVFCRTKQPHRP